MLPYHLLSLDRYLYPKYTTIGKLFIQEINKESYQFCFSLEDVARAFGIKVHGCTAIPVTVGESYYNVDVTKSERFQKELPIIYTHIELGKYILKGGGIEFEAIRAHGGNSIEDTDGCVCVAFAFDGVEKIYNPDKSNRADDALTALIKDLLKTAPVKLRVRNLG